MIQAKYIIWDWNGTLLNDVCVVLSILNTLLSERGIPEISLGRLREIYQHPFQKTLEQAGFDFEKESCVKVSNAWQEAYLSKIGTARLHTDSVEILGKFRNEGRQQAILSSLAEDVLMHSLEHFGISKYFSIICGLQDRSGGKKTANAMRVMTQLGGSAKETLLIGDSSHDFEIAQELKCTCVLVARGFESKQKLLVNDGRVFDNFRELEDWLSDVEINGFL